MLLGVLLVRANEPVAADVLVDAMWDGQPDPRAKQKLQVHVHKLRRALGEPARLSFGPAGYRLAVRPGESDVARFAALVAQGAAADEPRRRAALVREALSLWRGAPYGGLDVPMLADEARRLAEHRLTALELLHEAELSSGRHAEVVAELAELVRAHPLRERLHGLLMIALDRAGRRADALEVYRTARRTLVEELGIEPGHELRAIEARILAGEPEVPTSEPTPAQLPHNVRGFVGRAGELAELDGVLDGGVDAALISAVAGTAGVGKTALAVRWAHRVRDRFPDGQLYVDLRGYGPEEPVSPMDALAGFLRALGVEGAGIPQDPAERSALFRTLVDDRRMLVVLDNARTTEQIRPLLPGSRHCFVLVTSRDSLAGLVAREGARRIDLDRLPANEAAALLRELIGDRSDDRPDALGVLVELCARLPLALRVAAELIRSRRGSSVAELVTELADEQRRLDVFDAQDDPQTAVRAVFSWSYRQLSAQAALVFRLFGLHPGRDTDAYAMVNLSTMELREVRRVLDTLVRANLIDETAPGRYEQHDLLRAYAAELLESTEDEVARDAALARLLAYYLHTAVSATKFLAHEVDEQPKVAEPTGAAPTFADIDGAVAWLNSERANLVAASVAAVHTDADYPTKAPVVLWRDFEIGGHFDEALIMCDLALAAARRLGRVADQAHTLRMLSNINRVTGDVESAIRHAEDALRLYRELGDRRMQASALSSLGAVMALTGRLRDSARHFEQAIAIRNELGVPQHNAVVLGNLAHVHRTLGNHELANECVELGVAAAEEGASPGIQSFLLHQLAELRVDQGRFDEAVTLLDRVLTLARSQTRKGHARELLGTVRLRTGDHAQAVEQYTTALAIGRATGERNLIARALTGLGETHRLTGDLAEALRHYREARETASASDDRFEQGRAHAGLGDVHAELGEHPEAAEQWRQALSIFDGLGVPHAAEVRAKLDG